MKAINQYIQSEIIKSSLYSQQETLISRGNCRTACLGWGGRTQFDLKNKKKHIYNIFVILYHTCKNQYQKK